MYKAMIKKSKNKKGFTLVELIVVMAILAILAAILIPSIGGMIRRSNQSADDATGRNLYMAGSMAIANDQTLSVGADLSSHPDVIAFMGTFPAKGKTAGATDGNFSLVVANGEDDAGNTILVPEVSLDSVKSDDITFSITNGGFDWDGNFTTGG